MIITCTNCATRFSLAADAIRPEGRTLRCSRCGHTWRQLPDGKTAPQAKPAAAPTAATAAPAPTTAPAAKPAEAATAAESHADLAAVAEPPSPVEAKPQGRAAQLRAEQRLVMPPPKPPRRPPSPSAGWGLLLMAIAGLGIGGYAARETVLEFWPASERVYAALGLMPEKIDAPAFLLRNVTTATEKDGDKSVVVVKGEIVNLTKRGQAVPPLRVAARDRQRKVLQEWTVDLGIADLAGDAAAAFTQRLDGPPPGAADLEITLQTTGAAGVTPRAAKPPGG
jgi:predicted Zn finger-like uncharacterized protein